MREGNRKDITPTILSRYGIDLAPIGNVPAVNGFSLYALLPSACVPEGQAYIDYSGSPICCSGLTQISLDKVLGQLLIPATGATGDNSGYCT
jgi:hypothetical protein